MQIQLHWPFYLTNTGTYSLTRAAHPGTLTFTTHIAAKRKLSFVTLALSLPSTPLVLSPVLIARRAHCTPTGIRQALRSVRLAQLVTKQPLKARLCATPVHQALSVSLAAAVSRARCTRIQIHRERQHAPHVQLAILHNKKVRRPQRHALLPHQLQLQLPHQPVKVPALMAMTKPCPLATQVSSAVNTTLCFSFYGSMLCTYCFFEQFP